MMSAVVHSHIEFDNQGRPWVSGTRVKVIEVVLDHIGYGFSPTEIHLQHPDLSLAQIHAALSYYFDHQREIDAQIDSQVKEVDQLWAQNRDSPGRRRLRAMGLLP
jgi:uncharacterized protein (DUF433 family)